MVHTAYKVAVKMTVVFALILTFASQSFAQGAPSPAADSNAAKPTGMGPRKQLATILFMGLGGAVLGLSTLSFYGRPQDKLSNIAIGFAFGVIVGTSIVTYKAATNPQDLYGENDPFRTIDDSSRGAGYIAQAAKPNPLKTSWSFEF